MRIHNAPTRSFRHSLVAIAIGVAAITVTSQAHASCGGWIPPAVSSPPVQDDALPTASGMLPAVYRGGGAFVRVADDRWGRGDRGDAEAGIVGTWRFTLVSDGTAYPVMIRYGATVDFGTHQWHSDNTEMYTSGARAPSTGDVCMGVWKQIGPRTYTMKHIALAWVGPDSTPPAATATYLGPAIIRETVTLNRERNGYEGTFTLDQYAQDETTLLEHIGGKVVATRFTLD